MTTTKIGLFAGAAVIVAGGLVFALRMNPSTSTTDGQGAIGASGGQTYKAEISMAFRAGSTQMSPGTYNFKVSNSSGVAQVLIQKTDGSASAILMPIPGADAPKAWQQEGNPKISFNCLDGACTLARLWNGQSVSTYDFAAPKVSPADKERLAEVTVGLNKAS